MTDIRLRAAIAAVLALALPGGASAQPAPAPANAVGDARGVMGATGSMYDGNNADLKVPGDGASDGGAGAADVRGAFPPTAATGVGAAGASGGTAHTGGEH